jgi:glucosamine--fructose-6-phosphate aminotransferase (isomerizing)
MTSLQEYATYREIKSQTEAWEQAVEVTRSVSLPQADRYQQVIFTGCGSTYYLSVAAAAMYQEMTGCSARAIPAGEFLLNPQIVLTDQKTLLVAVSRSGTTSETVKAVEVFKAEKRGEVIVISNYGEVLSQLAETNIAISKGREESIAQTRSFASMFVAATALSLRMAGRDDLLDTMDQLPEIGNQLLGRYEPFAEKIGANLDYDRFYFLGSGIRYGLACEGNLKMKEMTLTHSEPFHFLEFRHGPMSMVNEKAVVIGMLSDANRVHEAKVLSEMKSLGGMVASLGETDADVEFRSGIPEAVRGVLYLPVLQLMAFFRSVAKSLNPDQPKNLTAVVQLNL